MDVFVPLLFTLLSVEIALLIKKILIKWQCTVKISVAIGFVAGFLWVAIYGVILFYWSEGNFHLLEKALVNEKPIGVAIFFGAMAAYYLGTSTKRHIEKNESRSGA